MQRKTSIPLEVLRYGAIFLVLGFFVFPIFWMVLTSGRPAKGKNRSTTTLPRQRRRRGKTRKLRASPNRRSAAARPAARSTSAA